MNVEGEGGKRSQLSVASTGEYVLGGNDVALTGIIAYCKAPGGQMEPLQLKKMPNGKLGRKLVLISLSSVWEKNQAL